MVFMVFSLFTNKTQLLDKKNNLRYIILKKSKIAFVMELADILVLGTSAVRRAGSSPAEGIYIYITFKREAKYV